MAVSAGGWNDTAKYALHKRKGDKHPYLPVESVFFPIMDMSFAGKEDAQNFSCA